MSGYNLGVAVGGFARLIQDHFGIYPIPGYREIIEGNKVKYEDYEKAIELLERSKRYLQFAHDDAEAKHDNYGENYMDSGWYEVMEETEALMLEIDRAVEKFGG